MLRHEAANDPVLLVEQEYLPIRPGAESQIRTVSRLASLRDILLLDHLQQGLCFAPMLKPHPANGGLTAFGQIVRKKIEHLAADQFAKEHRVLELGNRSVTVNDDTGYGSALSFPQRVPVVKLDNGIGEAGVATGIVQIDDMVIIRTVDPEVPFPDRPNHILAQSDDDASVVAPIVTT